MSNINDTLAAIAKDKAELISATEHIGKLLRHARLRWDSVAHVAASLRLLIVLVSQWLTIRKLYVSLATSIGTATSCFERDAETQHNRLNRESSGGFRRRYADCEREIPAAYIRPRFPELSDVEKTYHAVKWLKRIGAELDSLFAQTTELYGQNYRKSSRDESGLPVWSEIKKFCPFGGRAAYSVLLVAINYGKISTNLNNEHKLFGWHDVDYAHTRDSLRIVRDSIVGRMKERKGKAPSAKDGRHILGTSWAVSHRIGRTLRDYDANRYQRLANCNWFRDLVATKVVGHRCNDARLLLEAFRHDNAVGRKTVLRAFGVDPARMVATVITGRVEQVNDTDYKVAASWIQKVEEPTRGNNWKERSELVRGHLLLRHNWPDCHHADASYDLSPSAIAETLNAASQWYFQQLERQRIAELSAEQQTKENRIRIAQLVRAVRAIAEFNVEQSYRAGNCKPGTSQFLNQLGIQGDKIEGRRLAQYWRKANYYALDRFAGVVRVAQSN